MHTKSNLFELPELWMEVKDSEFLRELIDDSPYTVRELATRLGWKSHGHLTALRAGRAHSLKPEPALRLAKLLNVRVDRLFVTRVSGDAAQSEAQPRTRRVQTDDLRASA